jgi:hypothetical protein
MLRSYPSSETQLHWVISALLPFTNVAWWHIGMQKGFDELDMSGLNFSCKDKSALRVDNDFWMCNIAAIMKSLAPNKIWALVVEISTGAEAVDRRDISTGRSSQGPCSEASLVMLHYTLEGGKPHGGKKGPRAQN